MNRPVFKKVQEVYQYLLNAADKVAAFQSISPLLLLEQEIYYKEKIVEILRQAYSNHQVVFGDELSDDKIAELDGRGDLFSVAPLIVIRQADQLPGAQKAYAAGLLAQKIGPGLSLGENLLIVSRERSLPSVLQKKITETGVVITCWLLFPAETGRWLADRLRREKINFSAASLEMIQQKIGNDLMGLENAVSIIAAYLQSRSANQLSIEDIQEIFPDFESGSVFDFLDEIFRGSYHRTIAIFHSLLAGGIPIPMLVTMIAKELQKFFQALAMQSDGKSEKEIGSILSVPQFKQKIFFESLAGISRELITWMLARLAELDVDFKKGRVVDLGFELERLFYLISDRRRR